MRAARTRLRNIKVKGENVLVLRPDADDDTAIHALRRWIAEVAHLPGAPPDAFVAVAFYYDPAHPAANTTYTGWYSRSEGLPVRLLPLLAKEVLLRDLNGAYVEHPGDFSNAS